ncbi:MAG TPA: flagellar assembly protein FliW, partial [Metabacillus sp.]|nr:flagellar assembly protein FliW [Metabacillus sp.]
MVIQTKYHGEMNIEENEIITFPSGIPGFLEATEFILLPLEQNSPFIILQSIQTAELGFVIVNPFVFSQDYEFKLTDTEKEKLEVEENNQIQVYTILT